LLMSIGVTKRDQGKLGCALCALTEARAIYEELGQLRTSAGANVLSSMGALRARRGEIPEAMEVYEIAQQILVEQEALMTRDGAKLLTNIGVAKSSIGDMEGAVNAFLRAREVREATGTLESKDGADLLMSIGTAKRCLNDSFASLKAFEHARDILAGIGTKSIKYAKLIDDIGRLKGRYGESEAATAALEEKRNLLEAIATRKAFVVDCGTNHTKVFKFGRDEMTNEVVEIFAEHVRAADTGRNVSLSRDVLETETAILSIDDFTTLLLGVLKAQRWTTADPVFIGATGGVRDVIGRGSSGQAAFEELRRTVNAHVPSFELKLLSGDEEAENEYRAACAVFSSFFMAFGKGDVSLLSGGGTSCQIAWGQRSEANFASLPLRTRAHEQAFRDAAPSAWSNVRLQISVFFSSAIDHWMPCAALDGAFVGTSAYADVAELGFSERFMSAAELGPVLDRIVDDLLSREGSGWDKAKEKWGDRVDKLWPIGAVGCLRLRALLSKFSANSSFYFAPSPPELSINVVWPVGLYASANPPLELTSVHTGWSCGATESDTLSHVAP